MKECTKFVAKNLWEYFILMLIVFALSCEDQEFKPPALEIEFILPASGIKGTAVTIHGKGFSKNPEVVEVRFGDEVGEVILSDPNSILVQVPGGALTGNVRLKTGDREATGPVFTYRESGEVSDFAGNGFEGLENGDPDKARFTFPWGITKDDVGNIFVADRGNHIIRKITPGGVVSTVAGSGKAGYKDASGIEANFNDPVDVAIDAAGNLFVSDFGNHCIRKIAPSGDVSTYAGLAGAYGNTNGTLTNARFFGPAGLAFDTQGNLFVADFYNHQIRKISPGGMVSTLAGSSAGCTNGTGTAAQFNAPVGLATDTGDNVYVADGLNHSIRKVTSSGIVTRIAGACSAGYEDGPVSTSKFNTPIGISVDSEGNLIVTDGVNNRIRKIYLNTNMVLTVAGSAIAGSGNGIGEEAMFNAPADIVYLGGNEFALLDFGNHKIRKVTID